MRSQFVYSYVPTSSLPIVMTKGLMGGNAILKDCPTKVAGRRRDDCQALTALALARGVSVRKQRAALINNKPYVGKGPNVIFKLPPSGFPLEPNHPTRLRPHTAIMVDLARLLHDFPGTKIFGMELVPYGKHRSREDRKHYLSTCELRKLQAKSAEDLWSTYSDLDKRGLYAPDVPHASVHVPGGVIPPKYLTVLDSRRGVAAGRTSLSRRRRWGAAWLSAGSRLKQRIERLRPQIADAAQRIYEEWNQDEEGFDEDLGCGGICDAVANTISDVLADAGINSMEGGQPGDDHAFVVAVDLEEASAVVVDIPPWVYETGGGYSWKKRHSIVIGEDDVVVEQLDPRSAREFLAEDDR